MKLLILGDMAPTGFGTVTMDLGQALLDMGTDVRFLSWNEIVNLPEPFASRTATLGTPHGWLEAQVVKSKLEHLHEGALFDDLWAPDTALVLGDVASMIESRILDWFPESLRAFHYAPIEGIGLPPSWMRWWSRFSPIAMSEFGADQLAEIAGVRPPVIYHGVDTTAFHPVSPSQPITWRSKSSMVVIRSKTEAKRAFGIPPDSIFIFRADANVVRKAYLELFMSLAPIVAQDPRIVVGVHCKARDYGGDMDDMLSHFPPQIRARMGLLDVSRKFAESGARMPREVLAALYNAADIYVSNACEGFGLTIAEALACGTPAVGLDWSAVPEVIGNAGTLVPPGRLYPNNYGHFWAVADVDKMTEAVGRLSRSAGAQRNLGALGPIHVGATFRWPKAAEQFLDVMSPKLVEVAA